MITLKKCVDIQDAMRHKMSLDAAGIQSFIPHEHSANLIGAASGVRLQVAAEDLEQARIVLKDFAAPPDDHEL